jgi:hypothetical protein
LTRAPVVRKLDAQTYETIPLFLNF